MGLKNTESFEKGHIISPAQKAKTFAPKLGFMLIVTKESANNALVTEGTLF